jgi:xanthine/CO dehydrogenase XdhC/CoxF family maturation factor
MTVLGADDVLMQAVTWRQAGRQVALATVVATWGSAPRPVGSQLAVDETGRFIGSVSGGCVEAAVVDAALTVIRSQEPKMLTFGVSDSDAWAVGLACGGRIKVFVEALS